MSAQPDNTYLLYMYIISNPFSENFPKPIDQINVLNSNRDKLAAKLSGFDASYLIVGTEFVPYIPTYVN